MPTTRVLGTSGLSQGHKTSGHRSLIVSYSWRRQNRVGVAGRDTMLAAEVSVLEHLRPNTTQGGKSCRDGLVCQYIEPPFVDSAIVFALPTHKEALTYHAPSPFSRVTNRPPNITRAPKSIAITRPATLLALAFVIGTLRMVVPGTARPNPSAPRGTVVAWQAAT
jgi:hypothetical protein